MYVSTFLKFFKILKLFGLPMSVVFWIWEEFSSNSYSFSFIWVRNWLNPDVFDCTHPISSFKFNLEFLNPIYLALHEQQQNLYCQIISWSFMNTRFLLQFGAQFEVLTNLSNRLIGLYYVRGLEDNRRLCSKLLVILSDC